MRYWYKARLSAAVKELLSRRDLYAELYRAVTELRGGADKVKLGNGTLRKHNGLEHTDRDSRRGRAVHTDEGHS